MKKKPIIGIAIALVIIIAVIVGISMSGTKSDDSMTASKDSSNAASSSNSVSIKSYMFTPMSITVKVGTKVTWTNEDAVAHTVTADKKSDGAPASMDIPKNGSYSFTFMKAGTYSYFCMPHPYMKGTVTVTE